jgi:hypothetical protein
MFLLLGDPALRLPAMASDVELKVTGDAKAGAVLTVLGTAPARLAGAKVHVTLDRPVSSTPPDLETIPPAFAPLLGKEGVKNWDRDKAMLANHERSNRFALATRETEVRDGRFEVKLELPKQLPYVRLILRVYAATDREEGMTAQVIEVKKDEK